MMKLVFCICKNKCADELSSYSTAYQHLCFDFIAGTISSSKIQNFKSLAIFSNCPARSVLDLVRNPGDRFFCNADPLQPSIALHIIEIYKILVKYQDTI